MNKVEWKPQYVQGEYRGYSLTAFRTSWTIWKRGNGKSELMQVGAAESLDDAKVKAIEAADLLEDNNDPHLL